MLTQLCTSFLLKVLYNVYFRHRGISTRFWWAATDLAYWNSYRGGQSHKEIERLHKVLGGQFIHSKLTSGDVIRIQPNHISFNSLAAFEAIHGVHTPARKGDVYSHVLRLDRNSPLTLFSETCLHRLLC